MVQAIFPAKYEQMILDEARRHAQILRAMGFDRGHAKQRVTGNLRWEYELHDLPKVAKRIDAVVDKVYGK